MARHRPHMWTPTSPCSCWRLWHAQLHATESVRDIESHGSASGKPLAWSRLGGSSLRRNHGGRHLCMHRFHRCRHRRGQWQRQRCVRVLHRGRCCQDRFLPTQQELSGASLHWPCKHQHPFRCLHGLLASSCAGAALKSCDATLSARQLPSLCPGGKEAG